MVTITLGSLLFPLIKGAIIVGGGVLLYGGGKQIYTSFRREDEFLEELEKVSEKSFSKDSLVSQQILHSGGVLYQLKIPSGYSESMFKRLIPALEIKLDGEIEVWTEEGLFHVMTQRQPIPSYLEYNAEEIVKKLKPYEFGLYLGESRSGRVVMDFTDNATPHLIFAGSTGGGKSNLINQGLCSMIRRYSPEEMELHLIDLKDGVELGGYKDVLHVASFSETVTEALAVLESILVELKRRNEVFKKHYVKKLSEYNKRAEKKLPRILIVADEFAQFDNISDKELKKNIYGKWEEILQKGRSTGIHVMIGTQVADANVFPKQIKGNIDARFGFKFTDFQHSKMITGGGELTKLPNIQGRGLFKLGTKLTNTQVPYISTEQVMDIIQQYSVERVQPHEDVMEAEWTEIKEESPENHFSSIKGLFMDEETFIKQTKSRYEE